MRCDHLDAVDLSQVTVQTVTVMGSVADQSCWESVEETVSEDAFNEPAFVRRSAFDTNGERKTVSIGESQDLRSLAAFGASTFIYETRCPKLDKALPPQPSSST